MTWVAPRTAVTGEITTAAHLNQTRDNLLALQATTAKVTTTQTTTSTAYADLATVGPAVTLSTDTTAVVTLTAVMSVNGIFTAVMGFAVSGATTRAAADADAIIVTSSVANHQDRQSVTTRVTGLTVGSNTFTAKYRVTGGTGSFANRELMVVGA